MKNLGSLILFFLPVFLFAKVDIFVDKNKIDMGQSVTLTIIAQGKEIKFPKISDIKGYKIISKAKSESVNIVGSNIKRVVKLSLSFAPDKNITIDPFEISIDGKIEKTKPVKIVVNKNQKKYKDISFEIFTDKKEAYVSEPVVVTLKLKISKKLDIVDYRFYPPKFENFWVKRFDDKGTRKYLVDSKDYLIKELKYVIFPQKSGKLKIDPAVIKIATPDTTKDLYGVFITVPKWKTAISNSIELLVKDLPEDVDLVGDFKMEVNVDKNKTLSNKPVNLTIKIYGEGNIENLDEIELDIKDTTIYKDKPKKIEEFINGKLKVTFIQKFSIISDKDYTIPPIKIKYFDTKKKEIKILKSKPIKIDIIGQKEVYEVKTDKKIDKKFNMFDFKKKLEFFLLGFLSSIVLFSISFFLYRFFKNRKILIKKSGEKELLNELLAYISEDKTAYNFAKELYEKIYENKKIKIDKKKIKKYLQKLKKS